MRLAESSEDKRRNVSVDLCERTASGISLFRPFTIRGEEPMLRLISHLAQFSSFSKQGEVLCTRGLEFLLENVDAREKFASYLSGRTGLTFGSQLEWRAEVRQADRCRPDLEACTKDGKLVVKLEAKLGAALGEAQLRSYAVDLVNRGVEGIVLVVVPRYRGGEAIRLTSNC